MVKEMWKPIKDYEGLYEISNLGRVKSVARNRNNQYSNKDVIMKPQKTHNGYLRVSLKKNGAMKKFRIHRLVAEAFIPNPDNLPFVNHKDERKDNNCVDNLEYCTAEYNNVYGTRMERKVQSCASKMKEAL